MAFQIKTNGGNIHFDIHDNQNVYIGTQGFGAGEPTSDTKRAEASFRNIIQHPDGEELLRRLHELIDGRRGADVGCVLMHCRQQNWLSRNPTKAEFCSEFRLIGSWQSVHKYLDENNLNALERANRIVVF